MKSNVIAPIIEGFIDSIALAISFFVGVVLAIVTVFSSFANHTLPTSKPSGDKHHVNANSH